MKLTDENKVSIVSALSLFCIVVVLKDVLHVKLDDIVYIIIVYFSCYWVFGFFSHAKKKKRKNQDGIIRCTGAS
jgi:Flp pilus assembly protein TadB